MLLEGGAVLFGETVCYEPLRMSKTPIRLQMGAHWRAAFTLPPVGVMDIGALKN